MVSVEGENRMSVKDGGPAFPVPAELCQDLTVEEQRGMTLRDYAAIKFAAAMLTMTSADTDLPNPNYGSTGSNGTLAQRIAKTALDFADAYIAERDK
jgi:hypothetical protein